MQILPPLKTDYGFYNGYVYKLQDKDLITALTENWQALETLANGLTEEHLLYRYDTG